jgi:hypothetical protein
MRRLERSHLQMARLLCGVVLFTTNAVLSWEADTDEAYLESIFTIDKPTPPSEPVTQTSSNITMCTQEGANENRYDRSQCMAVEPNEDDTECMLGSDKPACKMQGVAEALKYTPADYAVMLNESNKARSFLWQMEAFLDDEMYAYQPCIYKGTAREKCFEWFTPKVEEMIQNKYLKLHYSSKFNDTTAA